MTKKDFELIAQVISESTQYEYAGAKLIGLESLIQRFANELAKTNPQFNRAKFVKTAGGAQ
jgi:hypothetical protein